MKAQKANTDSKSASPVVLFGIDPNNGKPKGAKFADKHADLALKAAGHMRLQVLTITDPKIAGLAAHLPAGRIHANGRGFVPFIRRELYGKLVAAAGSVSGAPIPPATGGGSAAGPSDPGGEGGRRPRNWDDITTGDLVLAQDSLPEGWYAMIVADRNGDMLTLRWRDYPRERRVTVHRFTVALLYANGQQEPDQEKQASGASPKSSATKAGTGKRPPSEPASDDQAFPFNWAQIDVNHLVLAQDGSPWRTWWEAIPVEASGDLLTLRWRDHQQLGTFARSRFDLALLYPKTK